MRNRDIAMNLRPNASAFTYPFSDFDDNCNKNLANNKTRPNFAREVPMRSAEN